jgi:hypothetical protein
MRTYKQIVELFETAANEHVAVKSFATGPLSYLDSNNQNIRYPFIFLRPITSVGLLDNTHSLTFELYSLDVPKVSDENALTVMSNTELYLYDMGAYIRRGPEQQTLDFSMSNINPVNEAFQDRVYGWVANVTVIEQAVYNYCNFPTGSV